LLLSSLNLLRAESSNTIIFPLPCQALFSRLPAFYCPAHFSRYLGQASSPVKLRSISAGGQLSTNYRKLSTSIAMFYALILGWLPTGSTISAMPLLGPDSLTPQPRLLSFVSLVYLGLSVCQSVNAALAML
jgi:hypothetical protein